MAIKATHKGEEGFRVSIFGELVGEAQLIDTEGSYAGLRGVSVSLRNRTGLVPGPHRILVQAKGPWTINVGQVFPADGNVGTAPSLTLFQRSGDDMERWIRLPRGEYLIRSSHLGNRAFSVVLINADGGDEVLAVDNTGVFEGQRLLRVGPESSPTSSEIDLRAGIYALVVRADGDWEIETQKPNAEPYVCRKARHLVAHIRF